MAGLAAVEALTPGRAALIADVGETIRVTLINALASGTPAGTPGQVMLRVGEWPEDCCDAAVVLLRSINPNLAGRREVGNCAPFRWNTSWAVRVRRDCAAPALGSIYNIIPSTAAEDRAALILLYDAPAIAFLFAEQVQNAVSQTVFSGLLGFRANGGCVEYIPGQITPAADNTGCAGWDFTFTIEIDFGPSLNR